MTFDKAKLADEIMGEALWYMNRAEELQCAARLLRGDTGGELAEETKPLKKRCRITARQLAAAVSSMVGNSVTKEKDVKP